jgi:hypothetical protein
MSSPWKTAPAPDKSIIWLRTKKPPYERLSVPSRSANGWFEWLEPVRSWLFGGLSVEILGGQRSLDGYPEGGFSGVDGEYEWAECNPPGDDALAFTGRLTFDVGHGWNPKPTARFTADRPTEGIVIGNVEMWEGGTVYDEAGNVVARMRRDPPGDGPADAPAPEGD